MKNRTETEIMVIKHLKIHIHLPQRILVRPNTTDGVWHIATLADTDVPDSIDFEVK